MKLKHYLIQMEVKNTNFLYFRQRSITSHRKTVTLGIHSVSDLDNYKIYLESIRPVR